MEQVGPIIIYSRSKPIRIRSGQAELLLQGTPTLLNNQIGLDNWINRIIKYLDHTDLRIDISLVRELKIISGCFLLIIKKEHTIVLVSDIIRSYPIFYGFHQNRIFITDTLEEFQNDRGHLTIDYDKLEEFIASGTVYGNRTVYKHVYGLQAAEIVIIRDNDICSKRYFEYKPTENPVQTSTMDELIHGLDKVLLSVFSRMINQGPNVHRWVIPLSGGHDSRIIVNYMYRLGVKNVVCFSYGSPNNEQSNISKQVSDALGYEWHFVEYTEQKWYDLFEKGIFDKCIRYAFNGVSNPHLQDLLAVFELKSHGIIIDTDIIIPGHTPIIASERNDTELDIKSREKAIECVYSDYFVKNKRKFDKKIIKSIEDIYSEADQMPENFQAFIFWQERQSKFLANSVRSYELLGLKSQMPFWDRELVDFWLKLPTSAHKNRNILFKSENQMILHERLIQIPFAGEIRHHQKSVFEMKLKQFLPEIIIVGLLRLTHHKMNLNEGANLFNNRMAKTVKELLNPIHDYPYQIQPYFQKLLHRYIYQVDPAFLMRLYTIRKTLLNRNSTDFHLANENGRHSRK
jgi:asparagine synthase (glutamine-hydrolysing)